MVYAGTVKGREVTLGVSGRLIGVEKSRESGIDTRNLVMWDPETKSLWNQMRGEAVYGPAKGDQLDMLPAVFVGLGTWSRMHPETRVLDLEPVRAARWHFTTEDLARGTVKQHEIAVALRRGEETLAVRMSTLHEQGVVHFVLEDTPLAAVWVAEENAALVFERASSDPDSELRVEGRTLHAADGKRRWNALTGAAEAGTDTALVAHAYIPCYLAAWQEYYPASKVFGGK